VLDAAQLHSVDNREESAIGLVVKAGICSVHDMTGCLRAGPPAGTRCLRLLWHRRVLSYLGPTTARFQVFLHTVEMVFARSATEVTFSRALDAKCAFRDTGESPFIENEFCQIPVVPDSHVDLAVSDRTRTGRKQVSRLNSHPSGRPNFPLPFSGQSGPGLCFLKKNFPFSFVGGPERVQSTLASVFQAFCDGG
jgi:hypothetical protein